MKTHIKIAIGLIFACVLSVGITPSVAHACSCIIPEPPRVSLEKADAVFVGTVTDVKKGDSDLRQNISLTVERSWKGVSGSTVSLSTARDSAACGVNLEAGKQYLIYAYKSEDQGLVTSLCSRTHEITGLVDNDEDVQALGTSTIMESTQGNSLTILIGLAAVVAALVVFRLTEKSA